MHTAVRATRNRRRSSIRPSPDGFTFCLRTRRGLLRFELTRKQAQGLEKRLSRLLQHTELPLPEPAVPEEQQWLEPQIM